MNPPQTTDRRELATGDRELLADERIRVAAARAAQHRYLRSSAVTPRRALPLQYDEAGFPVRPPSRSLSERVRLLLLG